MGASGTGIHARTRETDVQPKETLSLPREVERCLPAEAAQVTWPLVGEAGEEADVKQASA